MLCCRCYYYSAVMSCFALEVLVSLVSLVALVASKSLYLSCHSCSSYECSKICSAASSSYFSNSKVSWACLAWSCPCAAVSSASYLTRLPFSVVTCCSSRYPFDFYCASWVTSSLKLSSKSYIIASLSFCSESYSLVTSDDTFFLYATSWVWTGEVTPAASY